MNKNLNVIVTTHSFTVAGNEITITRTRPTKKTQAVKKIEKYLAKHNRTSLAA